VLDVSVVNTLNRTVNLSNIIRAQYASGRIALPVNNGPYTRLKHVEGIPARSAGEGFPVSKLRMIDYLVDRLVRLKGRPMESVRPENDAHADRLIARYAAELSSTLRNASSAGLSYAAGVVETGVLVNLVA
jgi:hypothetical protein